MAINDGGIAFPWHRSWMNDRKGCQGSESSEGMSLRDHFASHAPPYPFALPKINPLGPSVNPHDQIAELIATWNYAYADQMLAKRKEGGTS